MPILSGLDFKRKGVGCLILDKRGKKTKCVGVIVRRRLAPGYKLCPLAKQGFVFNMPVPKTFKSIRTAEQWVQRHAELWNSKRTYTPLNFLIYHILSDKLIRSPIVGLRLQVVVMQVLLAVVLAFCLPDDSLALKVGVYNKKNIKNCLQAKCLFSRVIQGA